MEILGCRLDLVDAPEAASHILALGATDNGAQIVTLGTEMVVYAQRDERFRAIVNACELSLCDTIGLLAVARLRGATLHQRVTGVDLIERLCEKAARTGLSIYFFGGAEGVAAAAAAQLAGRYPGLRIAGTRSGYFDASAGATIAAKIRESGARLLFCGLGSPLQEYWLAEYLHATGCGAGIGVGGSFDVLSGRTERAPETWRKFGLEWLYRLVSEPRRWRRQLALPAFAGFIALDALGLYGKS